MKVVRRNIVLRILEICSHQKFTVHVKTQNSVNNCEEGFREAVDVVQTGKLYSPSFVISPPKGLGHMHAAVGAPSSHAALSDDLGCASCAQSSVLSKFPCFAALSPSPPFCFLPFSLCPSFPPYISHFLPSLSTWYLLVFVKRDKKLRTILAAFWKLNSLFLFLNSHCQFPKPPSCTYHFHSSVIS